MWNSGNRRGVPKYTTVRRIVSSICLQQARALVGRRQPNARAVVEMVRVTRPGGRASVLDLDWHTLTIAGGDIAWRKLSPAIRPSSRKARATLAGVSFS
jgi:hypothetical protein